MIRISNIKAPVTDREPDLRKLAAKTLKTAQNQIINVTPVKKSVDARRKEQIHFIYSLDVTVLNEEMVLKQNPFAVKIEPYQFDFPVCYRSSIKRPVVVGMGPAGMFAGLILAQAGLRPIILERGRDVDSRRRDVHTYWEGGKLQTDSNVQFGEGGAGTFSDGKLTTGIKDPNCRKVLQEFYEAGAPEEILYLAKPHIGTDKLAVVVKNIRQKLISLGADICFETRLEKLHSESGVLQGITVVKSTGEKEEIDTDALILAIGHSARDTFEMLYKSGVHMVQKPFSVGARIEHHQSMVDRSQWGQYAGNPLLGAADYKLACHLPQGRDAYTFCMCPGGVVVAAASEPDTIATNGMSEYARDSVNANAALLVNVTPQDFPNDHPLAGIAFQREIERKAFAAGELSGKAPAQLVGDFLSGAASKHAGNVQPSYRPGVIWTSLEKCLPLFVTETMRQAIVYMDRKLEGFASSDAVLTAPETRSSSPVRILRGEDLQSNIAGIYPCGEGAGYAGGIMSAAVDGIRCALCILQAK